MDTTNLNKYDIGQVLLIDKPLQWTSFDVVRKVRNLTRTRKVGHAGTLDPLASGLLIVCTGRFTKRINEFMAQEKEYTGHFTLGASTPTYDLESEPEDFRPVGSVTEDLIRSTINRFTGEIQQVPPAHSAIKVGGQRVYELARKGREVRLEPRPVRIQEFEVVDVDLPRVGFRVVCSTGTYIRSLAHDFGQALGCGAYLSSLRRTRIGEFLVADALTLADLEKIIRSEHQ
ncbi:MAG TPA: tRNA pseudouridine(55) synthase TruB [Chitinophagaceae bacterium]|nr:tRNA pseudouridine(55) synthase TruB [Chitinophagaceae bacterium]